MTARLAADASHLYKVTDVARGKFYIGKHGGREQRGYWGSGLLINRHIKKYGLQDMKYEILVIADEQYILDLERRYVTDEFIAANPDCLNLCKGGLGGNLGKIPWNKGVPADPARIQKMVKAREGKPGHRLGIKMSQETKNKIKMAKANRPKPILSDAGRQAIIAAARGRKHTLITCPHCGKTGGATAMPRWHFDNCKTKDTE